jgi:hypothetical protein
MSTAAVASMTAETVAPEPSTNTAVAAGSVRWHFYLKADGASRRRAFASYVAALDAEEAAASEMASLVA